ncbi:MAG: hybrid sensor histidine kinase/response regulator [Anaerolineae bacterium]|nr:hybrid sensor histidine kinase/response regulator [Anaerolineae bacterium]
MSDKPIRVLLVEDNLSEARLIQGMLATAKSAPFDLECADRLSTGLDRLAAGDIDVALLDLSLPDSQGLETFTRAHAQAPQVPMIVLTGLDDEKLAVKAVREGAQDYLVKGQVSSNPLVRAIRYAIERKRAEETLRQYASELEARNEELDTFAHTVAHGLKNRIGIVTGFAETLEMEDYTALEDEELHRYLHTIAQNARKMSSIIDGLLLLAEARKVEVKMRPLDMARIVTEAQQRLTDMIEDQHAEIILPDTWPAVLGYDPWVEEVWVNYFSNAIKYGGQPPRVELGFDEPVNRRISADSLPHRPADGSTELAEVSMVRFWVRDNGPGIPAEDQARLFAPFTQLDGVHAEGHGLGLSIVRHIVEKLGGQVGVESQVGRGSAFTFTLLAVSQV